MSWRGLGGRLGVSGWSYPRVAAFLVLVLALFVLTGVLALSARSGEVAPSNVFQSLVAWVHGALGLAGTIFGLLLVLIWAARCFLIGRLPRLPVKAVGVFGTVVSICGLGATVNQGTGGLGRSGTLGDAFASWMVPLLSTGVTLVVFSVLLVGSLLLATNWFFLEEFRQLAIGPGLPPAAVRAGLLAGEPEVSPAEERALTGEVPGGAGAAPEPAADEGPLPAEPEVVLPPPPVPREEVWAEEPSPAGGAVPRGAILEEAVAEEAGEQEAVAEEAWEPEQAGFLWREEPEAEPRVGMPEAARAGTEAVPAAAAAVEPGPEAEEELLTRPVKFAAPAEPAAANEPAVEIPRPAANHPPAQLDPELVDRAALLVIETGRASLTMLQRQLQVRFAQASQLMDELEGAGVVGPYRGSLPREIRMSAEQWRRQGVGDHP